MRSLAGLGLVCGATTGSVHGCDGDPRLYGYGEGCGLTCSSEGVLGGDASISGIGHVDAFFAAVIDVHRAALSVSGSIRADLEGIAASLGIEGTDDLALPELTSQVKAGIEAKLAANVRGGLKVESQPARCEADIAVTAKAAAQCDVELDPATVVAECEGTCEVSEDVAAQCAAMNTLECEGRAPDFQCAGTCSGSCQLAEAGSCAGTCNGTCDAECTVCAGGACNRMDGETTNCAGRCMGNCQGECKLEAGGACGGRCEGACKYDPGMAMCESGATAKCDVSAMADAKCRGKCEGTVIAPMVKPECQASVEAKAKAEVVCTPPSLTVDFQFAAELEGDLDAQAEFKSWLEGFKVRLAGLIATKAKAALVADAAVDLVAAGDGAVKASFDTLLNGGVDLASSVGLACALEELDEVVTLMDEAQGELTASANAFVEIGGVVGAGG